MSEEAAAVLAGLRPEERSELDALCEDAGDALVLAEGAECVDLSALVIDLSVL